MKDAKSDGPFKATLKRFGWGGQGSGKSTTIPPCRRPEHYLSPQELEFYRALTIATRGRAAITCKVPVSDLLQVPATPQWRSWQKRIDLKQASFALCHRDNMVPFVAIALEDVAGRSQKQQAKAAFLNDCFAAAGTPLLRFPARRTYSTVAIAAELEPFLPPVSPPAPHMGKSIACPKCGASIAALQDR